MTQKDMLWGSQKRRMTTMVTKKQQANLRRGGIKGSAETAARAREGKADRAGAIDELGRLGREDPWTAYMEIHAVMTRHIVKLLREEEKSGGPPKREVTDRLREYRATAEALTNYRAASGGMTEAREFLDSLDDRIAAAAKIIGPPVPAVMPPV